jgi:outer membrane protein
VLAFKVFYLVLLEIYMRITRVVIMAALFLAAPAALAGKVAVLNMDVAVLQTETAKKAVKALQARADMAALVAKTESLKAEAEALLKEEKTKGETWPADKKQENKKKLKSLNEGYQEAVKKIQAEEQKVGMGLMQEMQPKLKAVIDEVMKEEKIDVIVRSQAVFMADPTVDITAKVTEKLNKAK